MSFALWQMLRLKLLTPKRERFALEYLIDLCATRAAIRSGFSRRTAYAQGSRLMKNPEVRAAIQANMDRRARSINVKADDVLSEISRVALHRIVVGLGKSYAPKITMQSKQKALDQLKRHLGPYGDKVQAACFEHFVERVQASSAETPVADVERPRRAAPSPASDYCDWLPPAGHAAQPSTSDQVITDYDPSGAIDE